jgi:hypothetical protein
MSAVKAFMATGTLILVLQRAGVFNTTRFNQFDDALLVRDDTGIPIGYFKEFAVSLIKRAMLVECRLKELEISGCRNTSASAPSSIASFLQVLERDCTSMPQRFGICTDDQLPIVHRLRVNPELPPQKGCDAV